MRMYPYDLIVEKDEGELKALNDSINNFGFNINEKPSLNPQIKEKYSNWKYESDYFRYIPVETHEGVISEMLESYGIKRDICLLGDRGSGKSLLVTRFAELIGSKVEPIVMYKDMTARDLLQQRATKSDGDTVWRNSSLVSAALEGKLAVLDGLDQVHSSTLAVIFR
jgi:MoxR-like ATPase